MFRQLLNTVLNWLSQINFFIKERFIFYFCFKKGQLSKEQFEILHQYIEKKSSELFQHEINEHKKNPNHPRKIAAHVGLDPSKWVLIFYRSKIFAIGSTTVFYEVIHAVLPEATEKYPEKFGTKNTNDVLDAIWETRVSGKRANFESFLKDDNFAYVVELDRSGHPIDKLLRVDFYRQKDVINGGDEFTGGAFHAYKHFTYKGVPLGTLRENYDLVHPSSIFRILIDGFFFHDLVRKEGDKPFYISDIHLGFARIIKLVFYHEVNTNVFFVASVSKRTLKR